MPGPKKPAKPDRILTSIERGDEENRPGEDAEPHLDRKSALNAPKSRHRAKLFVRARARGVIFHHVPTCSSPPHFSAIYRGRDDDAFSAASRGVFTKDNKQQLSGNERLYTDVYYNPRSVRAALGSIGVDLKHTTRDPIQSCL